MQVLPLTFFFLFENYKKSLMLESESRYINAKVFVIFSQKSALKKAHHILFTLLKAHAKNK